MLRSLYLEEICLVPFLQQIDPLQLFDQQGQHRDKTQLDLVSDQRMACCLMFKELKRLEAQLTTTSCITPVCMMLEG